MIGQTAREKTHHETGTQAPAHRRGLHASSFSVCLHPQPRSMILSQGTSVIRHSFASSGELKGWYILGDPKDHTWVSQVTQMVKNLPGMWEIWVWSLSRKDLLEKGLATHSTILAWRTSWTEQPGRQQSTGSQRVRHDWVTNTFTWRPCSHSSAYQKNSWGSA